MPINDFTVKNLTPSPFLIQKRHTHLLWCTVILSAFHAPLFAQNADESTTATTKPAKSIAQAYREGTEAFRNGQWQTAKESLNQVVTQAPGSLLASEASFFAALATLRSGDETWLQEFSDWRCQTQCIVFEFRSKEENTTESTEHSPDETPPKQPPQKTIRLAIERLEKWLSDSYLEEAKEMIRQGQWRWALHALSNAQATIRAMARGMDRAMKPENVPIRESELWVLRNQLECQVHLQDWNGAENTLLVLENTISAYLAQPEPPTWIPQVLLRRSEIAIVRGDWKLAESTVCDIRAHFPECNERGYVEYIFARCLVFNARFDEARQVFESIVHRLPTPPAELLAKAWWATAESYVMQRRFHEACVGYENVLSLDVDLRWKQVVEKQLEACRQAANLNAEPAGVQTSKPSVPHVQSTQRPTSSLR